LKIKALGHVADLDLDEQREITDFLSLEFPRSWGLDYMYSVWVVKDLHVCPSRVFPPTHLKLLSSKLSARHPDESAKALLLSKAYSLLGEFDPDEDVPTEINEGNETLAQALERLMREKALELDKNKNVWTSTGNECGECLSAKFGSAFTPPLLKIKVTSAEFQESKWEMWLNKLFSNMAKSDAKIFDDFTCDDWRNIQTYMANHGLPDLSTDLGLVVGKNDKVGFGLFMLFLQYAEPPIRLQSRSRRERLQFNFDTKCLGK